MTPDRLISLIHEYRAGLEAELVILGHLQRLADEQRAVSREPDHDSLADVTDERDAVMASLLTVERALRPTRDTLARWRQRAESLPEFREVARLHRSAADLIHEIGASDQETLGALRDAEVARRLANQAIEMGETTLAAYRRVIAPPVSSASLVDSRG